MFKKMKKAALILFVLVLIFSLSGCTAKKLTEKVIEQSTDSDVDIDEDGGVRITTEEGEVGIGSKAEIPDNFPSDVPIVDYDEVLSSSSIKDEEDNTTSYAVTLSSKKSVDETVNYYKDMMIQNGWTSESEIQANGTTALSYSKGENTCSVYVLQNTETDQVNATIAVIVQG